MLDYKGEGATGFSPSFSKSFLNVKLDLSSREGKVG